MESIEECTRERRFKYSERFDWQRLIKKLLTQHDWPEPILEKLHEVNPLPLTPPRYKKLMCSYRHAGHKYPPLWKDAMKQYRKEMSGSCPVSGERIYTPKGQQMLKEWREFCDMYRIFVELVIAPLCGDKAGIVFQRDPTLTISMPSKAPVMKLHCDCQKPNHQLGEITFLVPVTNVDGRSLMILESEPGNSYYRQVELDVGEMLRYDGYDCRRFADLNDSEHTQIYFEFKVCPRSLYKSSNNMLGDSAIEFTQGFDLNPSIPAEFLSYAPAEVVYKEFFTYIPMDILQKETTASTVASIADEAKKLSTVTGEIHIIWAHCFMLRLSSGEKMFAQFDVNDEDLDLPTDCGVVIKVSGYWSSKVRSDGMRVLNVEGAPTVMFNPNQKNEDKDLKSSHTIKRAEKMRQDTKELRRELRKKRVKPIPVVYQDDHIAILNKPLGISVCQERGVNQNDDVQLVTTALILTVNPSYEVPESFPIPKPVHRIDKNTSGLLVVAKTAPALRSLAQQFEFRKVKKQYLCLVAGDVEKAGTIRTPLDGKEAVTHYTPVKRVVRDKNWRPISTVLVRIETGRNHQIRRHMSSVGHPLINDVKHWKDPPWDPNFPCRTSWSEDAFYLMSQRITFTHPGDGDGCVFSLKQPNQWKFFKMVWQRNQEPYGLPWYRNQDQYGNPISREQLFSKPPLDRDCPSFDWSENDSSSDC